VIVVHEAEHTRHRAEGDEGVAIVDRDAVLDRQIAKGWVALLLVYLAIHTLEQGLVLGQSRLPHRLRGCCCRYHVTL
jgi:hypothetical protein